ncbi:MAG: S41 family peptidase [Clostridia bacterium]
MKKIKISTAIALILLACATTVNVTLLMSYDMINSKLSEYQTMQKELAKIYEVMQVIEQSYVGEIDYETALDYAAAGYVEGIGDSWSYYMNQEQYEQYLTDAGENLVGIGVNVVYDYNEEAILVTKVYDKSPALYGGVQKFDYIISVDGQKVSDVGYNTAVDMVTGERGTVVELEVMRNDEIIEMRITRDTVARVSVYYEMVGEVAYVQITNFESDTANQFKNALEITSNAGAKGFVFDLRNNPGGYLTKLVECLDIILPEGDVISTVSKYGSEEIYTSDAEYLDVPISVIVNSNSYSAAEFFAAAVQEYGVGTVVGESTTGKGYSQSPVELSDGSVIILSTNKYYTPQGRNLANVGVTPDIQIEHSEEEQERYYFLTTQTDSQIVAAVDAVLSQIKE